MGSRRRPVLKKATGTGNQRAWHAVRVNGGRERRRPPVSDLRQSAGLRSLTNLPLRWVGEVPAPRRLFLCAESSRRSAGGKGVGQATPETRSLAAARESGDAAANRRDRGARRRRDESERQGRGFRRRGQDVGARAPLPALPSSARRGSLPTAGGASSRAQSVTLQFSWLSAADCPGTDSALGAAYRFAVGTKSRTREPV